MSQSGLNIRMDDDLKREFGDFCNRIGMPMSTAFIVFAKTAVREQRFPFEIGTRPLYEDDPRRERSSMLSLLDEMQRKLQASGAAPMSLDEINAEIAASRRERRS